MTPSTVDQLLDIPGRSVGLNSSKPEMLNALPVRRSSGPIDFWIVALISAVALAAAVGLFGATDLPSAARASVPTTATTTPPLNQTSMTEPVVWPASEPPVVLRGQPIAHRRQQ